MKQPKTFCIALKDHPRSTALLANCLSSAKIYNWNIEIFWGVSKNIITDQTWSDLNLNLAKEKKFRTIKGMQGCFLSHYHLWNKCIDLEEPIIVLEHDAIILEKFNVETDSDLIKLHTPIKKIRWNDHTGNWSISTHAYLLNPTGASKLVQWSKENFGYNPDKTIGSKVLNWNSVEKTVVGLNSNNISTITSD